jgi:hypothetical protein
MTRAGRSLRLFTLIAAFGALAACVSPAPGGINLDQQQQAPPNTFRG